MKKVITAVALLVLLFLTSCSKKDETLNPDINAYVQGVLIVNGEALPSSLVNLDQDARRNSMTDQNGKFQFYGIQNGEHTITINGSLDNGSSIFQRFQFNLQYKNIDLGVLSFPKPPEILTIDTVSNPNIASIKWEKIKEPDFKSYSVFRKSTSDVYDSTSEMVYTTANISDTLFNDNSYLKGVTKYYRVYTYTSSGRIYASNIEGVNAPPKNYITNGSFETMGFGGKRPSNWTYNNQGVSSYDYMQLSSKNVKDGKLSLEVSWTDSIAKYSHQATLYQRVNINKLITGRTYKFSFWAKSETGKLGVYLILADRSKYLEIPSGQDWTELSYSFEFTKDISLLRVEIISSRDAGSQLKGWIDDMKLIEQNPLVQDR